jgi:RNA polymerase sigma-70 factor (ECF subfamily)
MVRVAQVSPGAGEQQAQFATTHWSVVLAAGRGTGPASREALATLCGTYWYPIYAYGRRRGLDADQAADLTQGFFTRLLEKKTMRGADPARGKFRSYMLGAYKHFLSHEWARAHAKKRGGGRRFVPIDPVEAETRYGLEPAHDLTPEKLYDRQWALAVLETALADLGHQCAGEGKRRHFDRFKEFLSGGSGPAYREAGAELGLSEGAVRVVVHRLRRRYRQILREHIQRTVDSPEQVDEEIDHLFTAIGR